MEKIVIPFRENLDLKADSVMRNVRMARILHLTKDGRVYSHEAEEYINNLSKYSEYCKEGKKEDWKNHIRLIVYATGAEDIDDWDVRFQLQAYEVAGFLMEKANMETPWDDLKEYLSWCEAIDEEVAHKLFEYAEDGDTIAINLYGEILVKRFKENRLKPGNKKQE